MQRSAAWVWSLCPTVAAWGAFFASPCPRAVAQVLSTQPDAWVAESAVTGARPAVEAWIYTRQEIVPAGTPVVIECLIRNNMDEPINLMLPDSAHPEGVPPVMGLPIEHIFSGERGQSFQVHLLEDAAPLRHLVPQLPAVSLPITLASRSSVGAQIELSRYCDPLHRPGTYEIRWVPYQGKLVSNTLRIVVSPLHQAVILTDYGRMTIQLFYDKTPRHVANFLELAKQGFYDGKTFHRVIHGGLIQGGCPRGDGTGIRPDGKLLKAEISDVPVDVGSVVMATRRGEADSGSCQFYIALSRMASLDGKQTVFGRLIGPESYETLRKIGSVPTGDRDRPLKPVYIRGVSLDNVPSAEGLRAESLDPRSAEAATSVKRGVPLPTIGPVPVDERLPAPTSRPTTSTAPAAASTLKKPVRTAAR